MWSELVKAAILGTDRTELSVPILAELQAISIDTNAPPEEVLAQALAYYRLLEKGAAHPAAFTGSLPEIAEAAGAKLCGPKSSRHLRLILDGTYAPALPEFIALMQEHGKALPPESIPNLLDRCLNDRELWQGLEPALGALGQWLIRQNPAWQNLSPMVDPTAWPEASTEQRRLILEHWRKSEPKRAIEELEKSWDDLEHREKAAFLPALATGLSLADEAFIEKALDDGRKPVRRAAAELLVQLPESSLQQRLFEAAASMLQHDDQTFRLEPPAELPKSLQRDGLEVQTTDYPRSSQRLGWFFQLVERIPPQRWETHLELEPAAIIERAAKTDKTKNFLRALAKAALLHQSDEWLSALARHWSITQDEAMWLSKLGEEVLTQLPEETANQLAIHYLERNEYQLEERSLAFRLLSLGAHRWSDRLTLLFITGLQNWLGGAQTAYGSHWHYKPLLALAAYRASPDLIPKLQTGWYTQSRIWGMWEGDVEQLMRVLYFRREMRASLAE